MGILADSLSFRDHLLLGTALQIYSAYNAMRSTSFRLTFTLDKNQTETKLFRTIGQDLPVIDTGVDLFGFRFPNWLLMEYKGLSPGEHTLTATLTEISDNADFIFDYLVYQPTFDSLSSKPVLSSQDLIPQDQTTEQPTNSKPSVGAIVGGVIGALGVLAILVLGTLFFIKRKNQRKPSSGGGTLVNSCVLVHLHNPPGY